MFETVALTRTYAYKQRTAVFEMNKVLSLHHEEENALFFSVQKHSGRLSLVDLICVLYRIGPWLE